jgi:hypothetical protein
MRDEMPRHLLIAIAAIAFVVFTPLVAPAEAQGTAGTQRLEAPPAPAEKSVTADDMLYARLLDTPPFVLGEMPRRRPAVLPALYVSFVALEAVDGYSTSRGLSEGAVESNPFVRWSVDHPTTLWAVKGAAAAGSIYFAERLWKRNRRGQAVAVMVLSNVIMGIVAVRNLSAIDAHR